MYTATLRLRSFLLFEFMNGQLVVYLTNIVLSCID